MVNLLTSLRGAYLGFIKRPPALPRLKNGHACVKQQDDPTRGVQDNADDRTNAKRKEQGVTELDEFPV